jgi:hypothetical protein
LTAVLNEPGLKEIESEIRQAISSIPSNAPFILRHNGDFVLGRLCYALARVLRPDAVVETGVCYGVTSSFLLQALKINGAGLLHSIDLPPLGKNADEFVGRLIPPSLKQHWKLYRGTSKKLLPQLLAKLEKIPLFVHDSLHTYRNIRRELQTVTPYLRRPAVVISDDVDGNAAFLEWVREFQPTNWGVVQELTKNSLLGVGVLVK